MCTKAFRRRKGLRVRVRAAGGRAGGRTRWMRPSCAATATHKSAQRTVSARAGCRHTASDGSKLDPRGTDLCGDAESRHSTCPARHDFDNVQRPVHCTIQDQPDARSGLHIENLPLALLEGELEELIDRDQMNETPNGVPRLYLAISRARAGKRHPSALQGPEGSRSVGTFQHGQSPFIHCVLQLAGRKKAKMHRFVSEKHSECMSL